MEVHDLLTVREVASMLRVSSETVRRWVREETLESIRIGDVIRIPAAQLSRFKVGGAGR